MRTSEVQLGYLAAPGDAPHPGVVMLHDVWGLSDHTRDLAHRLASAGFAVLALDLYRREEGLRIEDPGAFMRGLSDPQVLADVQAGIDFLAGQPAARGQRIGAIGFCMGGMYALMAACACADLSAAVVFYGLLSHEHGILHAPEGLDPERKPRQPLDMAAGLGCPLLAFYGDRDEFVPLDDVRALEARLAGAAVPAEVVVIPDAGHAFANDTRPGAYRPEAAQLAWKRTLEFFAQHLRGAAGGGGPRARRRR